MAEIEVIVKRKNIARLYMRVRDGKVYISAPLAVSKKTIEDFVASKKEWIKKRLSAGELLGADFVYLFGGRYELRVVSGLSGVSVNGNVVTVSCRQGNYRKVFYRWAGEVLDKEIHKYADYYLGIIRSYGYRGSVSYEYWEFKSMWGVCYHHKGIVRLNTKLIHYDVKCLEAVYWHEMAHFIEHNHQSGFKQLVHSVMGDYDLRMRGLK